MMKEISKQDRSATADQLGLDDEPFRRARFAGADEAAGRHARPDGQAVGRDHRDSRSSSNFKEGLSVLEYFNSTHGARKGLADTALKTANSGYLTRRLVDVAQDCIIVEEDCGTERGLTVQRGDGWRRGRVSLSERILGRTTAEDVSIPDRRRFSAAQHADRRRSEAEKIEKAGVESVKIRSVLTCDCQDRRLRQCYGRDLARGTRSISARRSASSPRSRSASRARS
jgi:DNA-directed RNA polymerase subunit beta'